MSAPDPTRGGLPLCPIEGLSLDAVRRFCAVTGDDNPIHTTVEAARAAGFETVVVPGLLLMGLFSRALSHWEATAKVEDLQIKFVHPVLIDRAFVLQGHVAMNNDGYDILRLTARDARTLFAIGEAKRLRA